MQRKRKHVFFIPVFILAALALLGAAVMTLWNQVLTAVAPVKPVSFWQALGLLALCKILFSPLRLGRPRRFRTGGAPWRDKLMHLSPEERQKFKDEWQRRSATDPNTS